MNRSRRGFVVASAAVVLGAPQTLFKSKIIDADGVNGILSHGDLFPGGDAAQGVADLIAAGAVRINDVPVPPPTGDRLDINGGSGLWRNADGTWSYNVQVLLQGTNLPYATAVVDFVNAVTLMRGIDYELTLTGGLVSAIRATITDVALANRVTRGHRSTTFTVVGHGDGSTDKPNPSTIAFPNANVAGRPQGQDILLYWKDARGWHLRRAESRTVTLGATGTVNGAAYTDSRLTLQYSEPWNRPTQPFRAMSWMGENNLRAVQWFGTPGVTVGFSRGGGAKATLAAAITTARHALGTVAISPDGSDVAAGRMWATPAYHDIFTRAVTDAQAALADRHATDAEYDGAHYRLAQAYGGQTGDRFSWLENTYFGRGDDYGAGEPFDTGYDGTGFWTFAQAHVAS
ncbi:hypothetical protein [Actinoplanes sp. NPDC051851]|uniref:hypothetical protein n=1 Tax=Actinoplanes sp. NPDC051851 TaxID=3154753 RepID=UPI00344596F7